LGNSIEEIDALGILAHQRTFDMLNQLLTDEDAAGQIIHFKYEQQSGLEYEYPPVSGTQVIRGKKYFW